MSSGQYLQHFIWTNNKQLDFREVHTHTYGWSVSTQDNKHQRHQATSRQIEKALILLWPLQNIWTLPRLLLHHQMWDIKVLMQRLDKNFFFFLDDLKEHFPPWEIELSVWDGVIFKRVLQSWDFFNWTLFCFILFLYFSFVAGFFLWRWHFFLLLAARCQHFLHLRAVDFFWHYIFLTYKAGQRLQ